MSDFEPRIVFQGEITAEIDESAGAKWIAETVNLARNLLNKGMRDGPQTGREYIVNGRVHIASKAGQWPAIRSGNLRTNTRIKASGLYGAIGSNVEYAEYLEYPSDASKARKLYAAALTMAIEDNLEDLEGVLIVRMGNDSSRDN